MMKKNDKIMVAGKRKTAVAKALIMAGEGKVVINKIPYENLGGFKKLMIQEPIEIAKNKLGNFKININVSVTGGGQQSQIEAARLAIAKAIVKFTNSDKLKREYLEYDKSLLVADTRRKEACKPGDSKARAKRQKSFR